MIHTEPIGEAHNSSLPKASGEFEVLDFLIAMARHKRFILCFTLGAAILAAVFACLIPKRYTATTTVLPPAQSSVSSAMMSQFGFSPLASYASATLGIKNPGDMYVALFHSRTVEDAVIQRFG